MTPKPCLSFVPLVALALFWPSAVPASASIEQCIEATCRITAIDGGRGTGCAFQRDARSVYVLTAAHVVGRDTTVHCEFWRQGHQSRPIAARVLSRVENDGCDAAVLAVELSQLGGYVPPVVPLAAADYAAKPGETIGSCGCANGAWTTGWRGHVIAYRGGDLYFRPAPANGRSGSALFDARGEHIIGIVRARTMDDAEGIATPVQALRQFGVVRTLVESTGRASGTREEAVQCPGGVCPAPVPYLLPYRYREQFRNQPQPTPPQAPLPPQPLWPTLPGGSSPSADLGPTNDRLDRIAETLKLIRGDKGAAPIDPSKPQPAAPTDPGVQQSVDSARKEAATARQEVGQVRQLVENMVGDPSTLLERFQARRDKVRQQLGDDTNSLDVARGYVRDFVKEKLSDGTIGVSSGKLLAGALGISGPLALAIGGGLWLVSRRIGSKLQSGEPLLIQGVIDRVTQRIDDLRDRLARKDEKPATPSA